MKAETELTLGHQVVGPGHTPNSKLPPIADGPKRTMLIEIEVAADFEKRLDNQWMVEREIHADRWRWRWKTQSTSPDYKSWAEETMAIINKLTPDIKGKAFEPGWFLLRQRLEEIERAANSVENAASGGDGRETASSKPALANPIPIATIFF